MVDGGYYENFGAITSSELVEALHGYGLKPFIILINNEPTKTGLECDSVERAPPRGKQQQRTTFAMFGSPLDAIFGTRSARGTHATAQLCSAVKPENLALITVARDQHDSDKALSMSWWLSNGQTTETSGKIKKHGIERSLGQTASLGQRPSFNRPRSAPPAVR